MTRVAVLGLGRMGTPIAQRLAAAGHDLSVWNRSPEAARALEQEGARRLARPADAWEHADVALTMLADGRALEAVCLGADGLLAGEGGAAAGAASGADPGGATGPRPGGAASAAAGPRPGAASGPPAGARPGDRVLIDMSTVSAEVSARVARAGDERGVAFLRAPVSGNPSVVRAGNLGIIVSGPSEQVDRLRGLLTDIGPNVFHVGAGEEARVVKLALNLMIGGTAQLMAEALVLAEKHGIGRADMLEVMGGSAIGSPFVKYKTDALVADDYTSTFSSRLLGKDLALALEAARAAELPLPLTALTQQLVQECIATGMGDLDFSALLPRLRREAGLADGPAGR